MAFQRKVASSRRRHSRSLSFRGAWGVLLLSVAAPLLLQSAPNVSALLLPLLSTTTSPTTTSSSLLNSNNKQNQGVNSTEAAAAAAPRRYHRPDLIRYRCRVAYDGSKFSGFQIVPNQRTVQREIEDVLSRRFNRPLRVVGAGRTDAGVHARGQAIHFDLFLHNETKALQDTADIQLLQRAMNKMLPKDVCVWNVQAAPEPCLEFPFSKSPKKKENDESSAPPPPGIYAWNVMQKATAKLYSYRICLNQSMDPLERHVRWQIPCPHEIDPNRLEQILAKFVGTNDFVCFAGALEQNARKTGRVLGTVRTVHSINLVRESEQDGYYRIDIHLDGALYKMVRNIVGTSLDACRGKITEERLVSLLKPPKDTTGRKSNPCKPAPPQGLTMERVYYGENDNDF